MTTAFEIKRKGRRYTYAYPETGISGARARDLLIANQYSAQHSGIKSLSKPNSVCDCSKQAIKIFNKKQGENIIPGRNMCGSLCWPALTSQNANQDVS
jgi:hypothetical protein